jgi:hypothetical protein
MSDTTAASRAEATRARIEEVADMLRSHTFTQPALACVGLRDSAPSAIPPQRIAL